WLSRECRRTVSRRDDMTNLRQIAVYIQQEYGIDVHDISLGGRSIVQDENGTPIYDTADVRILMNAEGENKFHMPDGPRASVDSAPARWLYDQSEFGWFSTDCSRTSLLHLQLPPPHKD